MQIIRIVYKVLIAGVAAAGVVLQALRLQQEGRFIPANFFSWLTIETNIAVVVLLLLGVVALVQGWEVKLASTRGMLLAIIMLVGIGNFVFLSGILDGNFSFGTFDSILLHYVVPCAMVGDAFLTPLGKRLRFVKSLWWMLPVAVFLAYSYIRGAVVHWYPYPFLDPGVNTLLRIAINIGELLVVLVMLITAVCYVSRFGASSEAGVKK